MTRALILVSVSVTLLLVPSALGTHGSRVWSGQWTTNTGGVGFRWVTDSEGVKAIKGQGGKPCAEPTDYFRGGYVSGSEAGKVTGCTAGSHLIARYVPNGGGESGDFDITFKAPKSFRGSYRTDAGASGPYTGSFKGHFGGDGGEAAGCRRPSVARASSSGAEPEPKCEYTVKYVFRVKDRKGGAASADGTLVGKTLNGLLPLDVASSNNDNLVTVEGRTELGKKLKLLLDVTGGTYRKPAAGPKGLFLSVDVLRSNSKFCPKGKSFSLTLQDGTTDRLATTGCVFELPDPTDRVINTVRIELDVATG